MQYNDGQGGYTPSMDPSLMYSMLSNEMQQSRRQYESSARANANAVQSNMASMNADFKSALRGFQDALIRALNQMTVTIASVGQGIERVGTNIGIRNSYIPRPQTADEFYNDHAMGRVHASPIGIWRGGLPSTFFDYTQNASAFQLMSSMKPFNVDPWTFNAERPNALINRVSNNVMAFGGGLATAVGGYLGGERLATIAGKQLLGNQLAGGFLGSMGGGLIAIPSMMAASAIADMFVTPGTTAGIQHNNNAENIRRMSVVAGMDLSRDQARTVDRGLYELAYRRDQQAGANDLRIGLQGYRDILNIAMNNRMLNGFSNDPQELIRYAERTGEIAKLFTEFLGATEVREALNAMNALRIMGVDANKDPSRTANMLADIRAAALRTGTDAKTMLNEAMSASSRAFGSLGMPAGSGIQMYTNNIAAIREMERRRMLTNTDMYVAGGVKGMAQTEMDFRGRLAQNNMFKMNLIGTLDMNTQQFDPTLLSQMSKGDLFSNTFRGSNKLINMGPLGQYAVEGNYHNFMSKLSAGELGDQENIFLRNLVRQSLNPWGFDNASADMKVNAAAGFLRSQNPDLDPGTARKISMDLFGGSSYAYNSNEMYKQSIARYGAYMRAHNNQGLSAWLHDLSNEKDHIENRIGKIFTDVGMWASDKIDDKSASTYLPALMFGPNGEPPEISSRSFEALNASARNSQEFLDRIARSTEDYSVKDMIEARNKEGETMGMLYGVANFFGKQKRRALVNADKVNGARVINEYLGADRSISNTDYLRKYAYLLDTRKDLNTIRSEVQDQQSFQSDNNWFGWDRHSLFGLGFIPFVPRYYAESDKIGGNSSWGNTFEAGAATWMNTVNADTRARQLAGLNDTLYGIYDIDKMSAMFDTNTKNFIEGIRKENNNENGRYKNQDALTLHLLENEGMRKAALTMQNRLRESGRNPNVSIENIIAKYSADLGKQLGLEGAAGKEGDYRNGYITQFLQTPDSYQKDTVRFARSLRNESDLLTDVFKSGFDVSAVNVNNTIEKLTGMSLRERTSLASNTGEMGDYVMRYIRGRALVYGGKQDHLQEMYSQLTDIDKFAASDIFRNSPEYAKYQAATSREEKASIVRRAFKDTQTVWNTHGDRLSNVKNFDYKMLNKLGNSMGFNKDGGMGLGDTMQSVGNLDTVLFDNDREKAFNAYMQATGALSQASMSQALKDYTIDGALATGYKVTKDQAEAIRNAAGLDNYSKASLQMMASQDADLFRGQQASHIRFAQALLGEQANLKDLTGDQLKDAVTRIAQMSGWNGVDKLDKSAFTNQQSLFNDVVMKTLSTTAKNAAASNNENRGTIKSKIDTTVSNVAGKDAVQVVVINGTGRDFINIYDKSREAELNRWFYGKEGKPPSNAGPTLG